MPHPAQGCKAGGRGLLRVVSTATAVVLRPANVLTDAARESVVLLGILEKVWHAGARHDPIWYALASRDQYFLVLAHPPAPFPGCRLWSLVIPSSLPG
jgi:hypothetical protein